MKLINKQWLLLLPAVVVLGACTEMGFKKTKTGLQYKVFPSEKGEKFKHGDFIKFNFRISYKDSVMADSYGTIPGFDMIDSIGRKHDFSEVLPSLKVGDSLVTYQLYDTLTKDNPPGSISFMKKGDKIKTTLKILGVYKSRDEVMVEYEKEMNNFRNKELAAIDKYLQQKGIKAEKKDGVYIETFEKGTGAAADSGKLVSIKYTGYNFEGKFFDSNQDSTKQRTKHPLDPFTFVSKEQGAIAGIMYGVAAFNKGGKGRIYIPSSLGYGAQGAPPVIKPNESLIFDIEVVDVKDKPENPQEPIMPPPPSSRR